MEGVLEKLYQVFRGEVLQHKHLAPGEQRGVHLERGVLRGCADEHDAALFHKGEEGVLLGFVEAVDLVHKEDGPLPHEAVLLRLSHDALDLFDAAGHRAEIDEVGLRLAGDDPGQGGLSHPRRAPEDHGGHPVLVDQLPQHLPLPQKVLLAHKLLQGAGTHPGGQGDVPWVFPFK